MYNVYQFWPGIIGCHVTVDLMYNSMVIPECLVIIYDK